MDKRLLARYQADYDSSIKKASQTQRDTQKEYKYAYDIFMHAETYQDLLDLNMAFLDGKVHFTPFHCGPIETETQVLRIKLLEINANGFMSVEGQPCVKPTQPTQPTPDTRQPTDEGQLSYIIGFMQKEKFSKFKTFFNNPSRKHVFSVNFSYFDENEKYTFGGFTDSLEHDTHGKDPQYFARELEENKTVFKMMKSDCVYMTIRAKKNGILVEDLLINFFNNLKVQSGGKPKKKNKSSTKSITEHTVMHNKKMYRVWVGAKGGQYIRANGSYTSIKAVSLPCIGV